MLATVAAAEGACAQRLAVTELQAGVSGLAARRDFFGAELGVARRPGDQGRLAASVALGEADGAAAVRVGATAQFVLKPTARSGTSPYAGVGLAFAGAAGVRGAGYLVTVLGLEAAPARPRGWYVEVGLEGGVRAAAGLRWRRFSSRQ